MKPIGKRQTDYLFVYGTLRKNHGHPLSRWLSRCADWVETGYFQGVLFNLGKYPGVVKSDNETNRVIGDIFRTGRPKMTLTALDRYEQCSSVDLRPHEYRRAIEPVMLGNGKILNAWIYLYTRPTKDLDCIVSGDYLDFLASSSQKGVRLSDITDKFRYFSPSSTFREHMLLKDKR